MSETRKIAAILVADIVGYGRLAGADEDRTLARLRALRSDLIDPTIAVHHGRVVKRTGDGSLIEFRSVVDAVRCAVEVQNAMVERNAGVPVDRRIVFRVGIHLGDVVEESDGDLMGDGAFRQVSGRLDMESPISAQPSSRTSKGRSGSIRCKSASPLRRRRRPRRRGAIRRRRSPSGGAGHPPRLPPRLSPLCFSRPPAPGTSSARTGPPRPRIYPS